MSEIVLILQLISTLAMVGLIWFVQIVHYPLFNKVGLLDFQDYERSHQKRTTLLVAPLMLIEAITAILLLWIRPEVVSTRDAVGGVLLVGVLWVSTYFWQVPAHERLAWSFDAVVHRRLVRSNWLRTVGWSARGVLVCWMILQVLVDRHSIETLPAVVSY